MSATEYEARREGDSFLYLWHALGLGIAFDQLQEDRWGLYGEMQVRTTQVMPATGRPGHVYQSRFNLSSGPDRDKLAVTLSKRDDRKPWRDLIEIACTETLRLYREGEPIVDLRDTKVTPQKHLIERLLPLGETSVLYGDGASAKSFLALACGVAARTGIPIGPFRATQQAGVLYLDWETTAEEQRERLGRICAGLGVEVPMIHYRPMWRALAEDSQYLRTEVDKLGVGLVIVDSIAPAVGGDVDSAGVISFFNGLRSFGSEVTRLVLSHVSKQVREQEHGLGDPFGSVFVLNFARSAWAVQRTTEAGGEAIEVGLFHRKVNRGPQQQPS
ncbi:MAG: AAA family ATPase, partial [Dehalococcoidia bacterium]|nr:AAA family ATPase [Dehalococcoidia bacterium]